MNVVYDDNRNHVIDLGGTAPGDAYSLAAAAGGAARRARAAAGGRGVVVAAAVVRRARVVVDEGVIIGVGLVFVIVIGDVLVVRLVVDKVERRLRAPRAAHAKALYYMSVSHSR